MEKLQKLYQLIGNFETWITWKFLLAYIPGRFRQIFPIHKNIRKICLLNYMNISKYKSAFVGSSLYRNGCLLWLDKMPLLPLCQLLSLKVLWGWFSKLPYSSTRWTQMHMPKFFRRWKSLRSGSNAKCPTHAAKLSNWDMK